MKKTKLALLMPLAFSALMLGSCNSQAQTKEHSEKEHLEGREHDWDGNGHGKEVKNHDNDDEGHGEHMEGNSDSRGEHSRETHGGGNGEENGTELTLNDTYDITKHGVRLVLSYDMKTNSFVGTMKNTTNKPVERARVEVHLSNGTELGPTKPITLSANAQTEVVIKATERSFEGWSTHAEVGSMEHGHGDNGEHGRIERNEHSRDDRG